MDPFWHLQMRNNKAQCSPNDGTKVPKTATQRFGRETERKKTDRRLFFREKKYIKKKKEKKRNIILTFRDVWRHTDRRRSVWFWNASLWLRHWNRRTLWVIESIHCVYTHDHVQAVDEDQQDNQCCEQPHPNPGGEEARAVAGVGEISWVVHAKALNLRCKTNQDGKKTTKYDDKITNQCWLTKMDWHIQKARSCTWKSTKLSLHSEALPVWLTNTSSGSWKLVTDWQW